MFPHQRLILGLNMLALYLLQFDPMYCCKLSLCVSPSGYWDDRMVVLLAPTCGGPLGSALYISCTSLKRLFKGRCAASTFLAIIFGWNDSGIHVPWFLHSTMQLPHQRRHCCWPCRGKALSYRQVFDIRYITWDEWSYSQLSLIWRLSDPRIAELCFV